MNLYVFFFRKYLVINSKYDFTSLTLIISILAILISVASITIILSVMSGFELDFESKIMNASPHITVNKYNKNFIKKNKYITNSICSMKNIFEYDSFFKKQAFIKINNNIFGIIIGNVDQNIYKNNNSKIGKLSIFERKYKDISSIILNNKLTEKFFINNQEIVEIIFPSGNITPLGYIQIEKEFKINNYCLPKSKLLMGYIQNSIIKNIFNIQNVSTIIELKVINHNKIHHIKKKISNIIDRSFSIKSWYELNTSLYYMIKLEKTVMFFVFFLSIILSSFGVVSFLVISIFNRKREIIVLKFLGMKNDCIKKIFVIKITIFNLIGILSGLIIGILISLILRNVPIIQVPIEFYHTNKLLVEIKTLNIIFTVVMALFASILSNILTVKIILTNKFK